MEKILGIDLGTNSVGWAIRDISKKENQIIDKGVLTFDKGVGEEQGKEVPLVKQRTEARSRRRNYQAKRYRKWLMLKTLIYSNPKMCPLSIEELDAWRKYKKDDGRIYPTSKEFISWLRLDFDGDRKPDFKNPYELRKMASEKKITNPLIVGRVFYNLVQRRGFRGRDDEEAKTILKGSTEKGTKGAEEIHNVIEKENTTLGAELYKINESEGERIRNRYNLRKDFEKELETICIVQGILIESELYKNLHKSIIWQRPLRTQKGNIGRCTLEPSKPRCPISHPLFEEFRARSFINNIKIRDKNDDESEYKQLDEEQRNLVFEKLFFRKSKPYFDFIDIIKLLNKNGNEYDFNYAKNQSNQKKTNVLVSGCPVTTELASLFECDLSEIKIFHPPKRDRKTQKDFYNYQDLWHVLFTFDSKDKLYEFAKENLNLDDDRAERFSKIKLQQGYANLSLHVIKKIIPFLRKGYLYNEAVYLANIHKVFNEELTDEKLKEIIRFINEIKRSHSLDKSSRAIANKLISEYLDSDKDYGRDPEYVIQEKDHIKVLEATQKYFGKNSWEERSEEERNYILDRIKSKYFDFLQSPPIRDLRLIFGEEEKIFDKIKKELKKKHHLSDTEVDQLYHHSVVEDYPEALERNGKKILGDPMPISKGFKNPMALKTLHKMKNLINYLLLNDKIDYDTRVVVEIARELTDANRRRAYKTWISRLQERNFEVSEKIKEMAEKENINIDPSNETNIVKYKLWEEQKYRCLYTGKQITFSDLFNGNLIDIEHTIPASISFNNELSNLTVCYKRYNTDIKGKKIPYQLPNYEERSINIKINEEEIECTPIKPRLKAWEEKVDQLKTNLKNNQKRTKNPSLTKEQKDNLIYQRRLIEFELDYWKKKLDTFYIKEYKQTWRNSQLIDTQIVTKYARPYLKTVFNKVEVQKGNVVSEFRKIFNIDFEKDRSKHTHHAIDAAVLTLIPSHQQRDKILEEHFAARERNLKFHTKPNHWKGFTPNYIKEIENTTLVNYQKDDRTLSAAKKYVRKRGKIQYVKNNDGSFKLDKNGMKIPWIAMGDSVRGQLHEESFLGAIKSSIHREDGLTFVARVPISSFSSLDDFTKIIDLKVREIITETVRSRMEAGNSFNEAMEKPIWFVDKKGIPKKIDKNNKKVQPIRHVRCLVKAGRGTLTEKKAIELKQPAYLSKYDYKNFVYVKNEENKLCLLYEDFIGGEIKRQFELISLYDIADLKLRSYSEIFNLDEFKFSEKNGVKLPLVHIIKAGDRVILYKDLPNELLELSQNDLLSRLYVVYKFNEAPSKYIYLQSHFEARPDSELGVGSTTVDLSIYQPRLKLVAQKFTAIIEKRDFEITLDGEINFK